MTKRGLLFILVIITLIGGVTMFNLNHDRKQTAQLEYLRAHEAEIVEFVKTQSPNIETVQIDWSQTKWGKVGNGLPQGGGEIITVFGGFNQLEDSSWSILIPIEDSKVILDDVVTGQPLRVKGKIYE